MKNVFVVCCLIFLSASKLFGAQEFVLDNGLRLIVVDNNKAPIVKQMLWYNIGAADEEVDAKGSAHLLEHLMFRGSRFNEMMEKNGVKINAFTSQDYTTYHEFMDISKLELALYLEAKRMEELNFSDEEFLVERDVVLQERKQVIENNPISKFGEAFNKSFWQQNPYSSPITGESDEIVKLSKGDVRALHQKYYGPNNAVLVLAGNIEPKTAFKLVKKYFGDINARPVPNKKTYNQEYVKNGEFEMSITNVNTPRFIKRYMAQKKSYALELFAKYLADGKTSYLYQKMVDNDKSALSVAASYNGLAKYGSTFSVSVTPAKDFDINKLMAMALKEFDAKDLANTKQKMTAGLVMLKDDPNDAAYIVGALASSGMSLEEIENYENSINAVSLDDVKKAVDEMLRSSSMQGEVK